MQIFNTPILFLIFNREDTTQKVFDAIRKQKPKYLFVAADGPRKHKQGEAETCQRVRDIIQVDWDCELKTLFREENLGCGKAVSSAITWFFENVEQGIILEDDCLPHPDFFPYCEELLERYKGVDNVKIISGNNFQDGIQRDNASYFFSKYNHIWGWASWRRVWQEYDFMLNKLTLKEFKQTLSSIFKLNTRLYWLDKFLVLKSQWFKKKPCIKTQHINTWDYQFLFSIWAKNGICITPQKNLISNIGFIENSTHTNFLQSPLANLPTQAILPLKHSDSYTRNIQADEYESKKLYHKLFVINLLRYHFHLIYYKSCIYLNKKYYNEL